jgi:hypothetical protein
VESINILGCSSSDGLGMESLCKVLRRMRLCWMESVDGDFQGWMVWRMCYREIGWSSCAGQIVQSACICSLLRKKCLQLSSTNSVSSSTFLLSSDQIGPL